MHALIRAVRSQRHTLALMCALAISTACGGGGGGGTSIHLSTNAVSLTADAGGDLPGTQVVTAEFDGDLIAWGIPQGGPEEVPAWLSFAHGEMYGNQDLSYVDFAVSATTTDLTPGVYSFVMRIATANGSIYDPHDPSYTDLTITYVVNDVAAVAAGPAALVARSAPPTGEGLGMRVLGVASAR